MDHGVLCACNKARCIVDRVETYLFRDFDRRWVLPENRRCTQTRATFWSSRLTLWSVISLQALQLEMGNKSKSRNKTWLTGDAIYRQPYVNRVCFGLPVRDCSPAPHVDRKDPSRMTHGCRKAIWDTSRPPPMLSPNLRRPATRLGLKTRLHVQLLQNRWTTILQQLHVQTHCFNNTLAVCSTSLRGD